MRIARTLTFGLSLLVAVSQTAFAAPPESDRQQQVQRDQLKMAVQEICPASGHKLGTHGQPIKVKVGQETLFLCCKACLEKELDRQHWATIHANFAKAQQICPVMEHELPENPKWTIVEGQIVYVCCPPCTEKIAANPDVYLRKVDALYSASLNNDPKR